MNVVVKVFKTIFSDLESEERLATAVKALLDAEYTISGYSSNASGPSIYHSFVFTKE
jgi:hypothetical protein